MLRMVRDISIYQSLAALALIVVGRAPSSVTDSVATSVRSTPPPTHITDEGVISTTHLLGAPSIPSVDLEQNSVYSRAQSPFWHRGSETWPKNGILVRDFASDLWPGWLLYSWLLTSCLISVSSPRLAIRRRVITAHLSDILTKANTLGPNS